MLPGIVAQIHTSESADTDRPEWVPEGADYHYDFVNGQYYDNGAILTESEAVGIPARLDAAGLAPAAYSDPECLLLGTFSDFILGKAFTLVVDFELYASGNGSNLDLLDAVDISGGEGGLISIIAAGYADDVEVYVETYDYYSPDISEYDERSLFDDDIGTLEVLQRIAFTYELGEVAISLNGGAAYVNSTLIDDFDVALDRVKLGVYNDGVVQTGRIRVITGYLPIMSASLPGMSAL